jgi:hypothetical protein
VARRDSGLGTALGVGVLLSGFVVFLWLIATAASNLESNPLTPGGFVTGAGSEIALFVGLIGLVAIVGLALGGSFTLRSGRYSGTIRSRRIGR